MADTHELLLLGLLDGQSMHGYKLGEFLEHRLQFVSDLKKPTAYRLLEQMYRQGLVERAVEREGRRPERMVYRLTDAGRERFERLLREDLASACRVVYPGNVALLFWHRLPEPERAELLARRRLAVAEQRAKHADLVERHPAGTPARAVLEHDLAHLDAELAWLDRTAASLAPAQRTGE